MGWQTPRGIGLEHPILQYEILCVGPVIRDLARIVPAHHIRRLAFDAARGIGVLTGFLRIAESCDETVHLAAINIAHGCRRRVRAARINIIWVVVWFDTGIGLRVIATDLRRAVLHRNAIRARVGAEVLVEGTVLLHNDNDMFDLGARSQQVSGSPWSTGGCRLRISLWSCRIRRGWLGVGRRDRGVGYACPACQGTSLCQ